MSYINQYFKSSRFAALGDQYYSEVAPSAMDAPYWVTINEALTKKIGFSAQDLPALVLLDFLAGNSGYEKLSPLSMLYAGHQFGHFVPQLGDGRAILLGDVVTDTGEHWELQLKGAGMTPYSRNADGRAVLRSTVREYLCSAAMSGLGIPTTLALSIVGSDDEVYREQIETSAVLARVAPSHIRFGSFEVFFHRQQYDLLMPLADYLIEHFYPELADANHPYIALFENVVKRTAKLIAQWQLVGFCHGVMNTDNMSMLGLTIDYGPFGFLDVYDPNYICNHSDHEGRYAYHRQPQVGFFNLTCLAQAMLPLFNADDGEQAVAMAKQALANYQAEYEQQYREGMNKKLGLLELQSGDVSLQDGLLKILAGNQVDFTRFFRALADLGKMDDAEQSAAAAEFLNRQAFVEWAKSYRKRLSLQDMDDNVRKVAMNTVNPKYILRNYLAQQAIEQAQGKDYSEIENLMQILDSPYDEHPDFERFAKLPPDWADQISVSCSS